MTSVQMRVSISPLLWCEPDEYTTRCACAIMAPLELMRLEMLSCLRMPLRASVATLHQQASPVDTQLERRTGARTLGFMLSVWSTATHAEPSCCSSDCDAIPALGWASGAISSHQHVPRSHCGTHVPSAVQCGAGVQSLRFGSSCGALSMSGSVLVPLRWPAGP